MRESVTTGSVEVEVLVGTVLVEIGVLVGTGVLLEIVETDELVSSVLLETVETDELVGVVETGVVEGTGVVEETAVVEETGVFEETGVLVLVKTEELLVWPLVVDVGAAESRAWTAV